jgi:hypothetical protein
LLGYGPLLCFDPSDKTERREEIKTGITEEQTEDKGNKQRSKKRTRKE